MAVSVVCFSCQKTLNFPDRIGFREECGSCRADVHVCKNCQFYDPKVYNECKEPQAERVVEKERFNRCDYFSPSTGSAVEDKAAQLRAAAEALFKKS